MHALTPAVRPERGSLGCPSTASPVVLFRPGQASPRHASTARADNETTTGGRNERRAGAAEQRRRRDPGPGSCSVPTAYDRAGSPELQRHARCEDSTGRHLNPCPVVSVSSRLKTFLCPYLLDDGLLSSTIMCSVYLSSVSFFFFLAPSSGEKEGTSKGHVEKRDEWKEIVVVAQVWSGVSNLWKQTVRVFSF
ncbi:hypothetical protein BDA96_01G145700 [Sorghum bicolor]|uniref:Uncharacterized protein n=2 Tax=Sorghum bicolor TaxID=4558 RepID=A0A921RY47_SORBI|nr:hypothetical protein BDA96_01G145700 [Sorghum bicolor]KXG37860.1 hypothetical protein SORBI_3001G139500 [Sorghum bicolor]